MEEAVEDVLEVSDEHCGGSAPTWREMIEHGNRHPETYTKRHIHWTISCVFAGNVILSTRVGGRICLIGSLWNGSRAKKRLRCSIIEQISVDRFYL